MPDKVQPETEFRDYIFATKAIETLKKFTKQEKYFMMSVGFKMPHLCQHVPYRTYEIYRNMSYLWDNITDEYRKFPKDAPLPEYRCCGDENFKYMNQEGSKKYIRTHTIEDFNQITPLEVYKQLMIGYSAAITFVDEQLGRLLDTIDELNLWNNITIVLTSDHGMHNGEKGLWEKWTLFDESTHIPLMIYHPDSPYKSQMMKYPVELIDIFPTIIDLIAAPYHPEDIYNSKGRFKRKYHKLQGKSLAPYILGYNYNLSTTQIKNNRNNNCNDINECNDINKNSYAVTQMFKCAKKEDLWINPRVYTHKPFRKRIFGECDIHNTTNTEEFAVMGYSLRSKLYRYTAWIPFDRKILMPFYDEPIYAEEFYSHENEQLGDLYIYESNNLIDDVSYSKIIDYYRFELMNFIKNKIIYRKRDKIMI